LRDLWPAEKPRTFYDALFADEIGAFQGALFISGFED